ncbi:hypothetical protein ACLOJK_015644 [Asimina triloba]
MSSSSQNNGGGKLLPNLDMESTKVLNLTVLQRIDPFVEEILITAAHVTFYEFNIDLNQWSRKDVEGSLFVVKSCPYWLHCTLYTEQNRNMIYIDLDNLVENLLGDFEYEIQVPYLLYRNAAQEVNGIWFYNSRECEEVANLFSRILNAYSKVPPKPKVSSTKSEFEELEAVPSMAVMEGPLEPTSSAATAVADVPDEPFAAMNVSNASSTTPPPQHPSPVPISLKPHAPTAAPLPSLHAPTPLPTSSTPLLPRLDPPDSLASNNRPTNLVKPFAFFAPPPSSPLMMPPTSSSAPTAPPLNPPVNLQSPYGTPLLQPFPPPTPSPSLTPNPTYGPPITRDKVRDALVRLAQVNSG